MWNIFDQWLVLCAIGWAIYTIYKSLSKKAFLNCNSPCEKKIFKKEALVTIRLKSQK